MELIDFKRLMRRSETWLRHYYASAAYVEGMTLACESFIKGNGGRKGNVMSDHEHGSMDTSEQQKTFEGFLSFSTKTVIYCILALVVVALVNG